MNLVLFEPDEIGRPLPDNDPRAHHIVAVLRRGPGEAFDAGLIDGPRGRAVWRAGEAGHLLLEFQPGPPLPPRPATELIIGLPRPQTARDILRDATTLGATALHFVHAARTDPNYARSSLWTRQEWHRPVREGAMQAFDPRLPRVSADRTLAAALAERTPNVPLYALDNYEATQPLHAASPGPLTPVLLAIGPERGWDHADRAVLRAAGATLVHLGTRVLRTETAVIAALTLVTAARERADKR